MFAGPFVAGYSWFGRSANWCKGSPDCAAPIVAQPVYWSQLSSNGATFCANSSNPFYTGYGVPTGYCSFVPGTTVPAFNVPSQPVSVQGEPGS